ncbi:carboxymuconolactone decarboxylase family protein [Bosea sp. (in: a-proteobacteria)]|uniref:carboxymuconolactone decarboxylase family protein n=1 Tax=Bosea sp. (in: a-proteobacteria) TaxID=1871050 RepID=UPI002FC92FA2
MARIPLPTPATMTPEQRRVYDTVVSGPRGVLRGPLLAALHRPELADKWQQFGELLRYRTSLPPRLSELAILVTARRWNCQLEWYLHESVAREAGLSGAIIAAIAQGRRPEAAEPEEYEIHDYCAELQETRTVGEEAYQRVLKRWGTVGVVELTALVGYYTMVAMTLNVHEIPLPEGATPPLSPCAA